MSKKPGVLLHAAAAYDFTIGFWLLGRERAFRERLVRLARLAASEAVLDVGCGTGSLAIAAKRQVGPTGSVYGIDASPEMLARARKKAAKAGVEVAFQNASAQALPFGDATFDAVLASVMLHHLPRKARQELAAEIHRVLKPSGRVLIVEFGLAPRERKGFLARWHRHGYVAPLELVGLVKEAGLSTIESGPAGTRDLHFVLAKQ
jgi:ubiquinone/menaquinone biosynthesis C-methylase UbiE